MQMPYTYYLFLFLVILNRAYHTHTDMREENLQNVRSLKIITFKQNS